MIWAWSCYFPGWGAKPKAHLLSAVLHTPIDAIPAGNHAETPKWVPKGLQDVTLTHNPQAMHPSLLPYLYQLSRLMGCFHQLIGAN